MTAQGFGLVPGDRLRIERRYVVDGHLTSVTDEGAFQGVERVGSHEHLVLKDGKRGVRMFPLVAIAEITVVKPARRAKDAQAAGEAAPATPASAWDPSVA